jgi:hypothetical protein
MGQRGREVAGFAGALVAHALAFAWVTTRAARPASVHLPLRAPSATELELVDEPSRAPSVEASAEPRAGIVPSSTPAPGTRETARSPSPPEPSSNVKPESFPAPSWAPEEPAPSLATLSNDALGIGPHNPFITPHPEGSFSALPSERRADNVAPGVQQSLRDAVHEHDHDVGLDLGGPVVTLAEDLTRSSTTPVNSNARFEVACDAAGQVTSVTLLEASEAWGDWDKLGLALADALRSRPLRVPAGTGGVAFTLEVTSRVQMPSGFDPGVEVNVFNIPFKKAPVDQKHPRKLEVLKIEPKIEEVPADPSRSAPTKLPQYRIQLVKIFGLAFDVSDIGAHPLRIVHARIIREKTL